MAEYAVAKTWDNIKEKHDTHKAMWLKVRTALSDHQKKSIDNDLYQSFVSMSSYFSSSTQDSEKNLTMVHEYCNKGASTCAFPDYELSRCNIGTFLVDTLLAYAERQHFDAYKLNEMLEIMKLLMIMGTEWQTNKRYVGNGGLAGPYFVLTFLATGTTWGYKHKVSASEPAWQKVYELFESMVVSGGWIPDVHFFLKDYFTFDTRLSENIAGFSLEAKQTRLNIMKKTLCLLSSFGFCETLMNFLHDCEYNYHYVHIIPKLHDELDIQMVDYLWEYLLQDQIHQLHNCVAPFVNLCFLAQYRGKTTRKNLTKLLRSKPKLSQWIVDFTPSVLFDICSRKERNILEIFVDSNMGIKHVRDREGNSLLTWISGVRGRTENMVRMLVENDFDIRHENMHGETAKDRALGIKHFGIVSILDY